MLVFCSIRIELWGLDLCITSHSHFWITNEMEVQIVIINSLPNYPKNQLQILTSYEPLKVVTTVVL